MWSCFLWYVFLSYVLWVCMWSCTVLGANHDGYIRRTAEKTGMGKSTQLDQECLQNTSLRSDSLESLNVPLQKEIMNNQATSWWVKIEQIQGNVLTNATKHKETKVHQRFRQKATSLGVRRETDNKRTRKVIFFFFFNINNVCLLRATELLSLFFKSALSCLSSSLLPSSFVVCLSSCVSSHWWGHLPRSVLFCQPQQQLFTHPGGPSGLPSRSQTLPIHIQHRQVMQTSVKCETWGREDEGSDWCKQDDVGCTCKQSAW